MGEPKSRSALLRRLEREHDGRVRRRAREVLRDLAARGRNETRRLREDLDALRRRGDELRVRLSKVEAKLGKSASPARPSGVASARRQPAARPQGSRKAGRKAGGEE
jgi:aminopeptidase N